MHHHNIENLVVEVPPEEKTPRAKCFACLKSNMLTMATVAGVLMGVGLGAILKSVRNDWTEREIMYISFPGDLFLSMLKSLILPLIISSLISAIASLDLSMSSKIAMRAIFYYLTTTFASVVLGIVMVVAMKPGVGHVEEEQENGDEAAPRKVLTVDTLLDLVRNMFPPNLIEACVFQYHTSLTPPNGTNITESDEEDLYKYNISREHTMGTNIIGLVVASVAIGIAIAQLGKEAATIGNFFHNLMAVMMKVTTWVIFLSPVGILFLVTAKVLEMKDMAKVVEQLGKYFATVLAGLAVQGFVVLPGLYFLLTRKNPFHFIVNISQAVFTAFGTASSTATLPLTIQCLEQNLGVDSRVARFALPIGATINMDGTALYEAVAAIFIAQVRDVPLDFGKLIAISITATAASIGAAGIPQAGLVTMVMVLDTVGLPAKDVTIILAVDWLLDRFRTAINVMGDAYGATIVNHLSQKELNKLSPAKQPEEETSLVRNSSDTAINNISELVANDKL